MNTMILRLVSQGLNLLSKLGSDISLKNLNERLKKPFIYCVGLVILMSQVPFEGFHLDVSSRTSLF